MQNTLAKSDARNMHIIVKNKVEKESEFVSKNPKMEFIIDNFGDVLLLFEIPLSEVTVTLENQEVHTLVL